MQENIIGNLDSAAHTPFSHVGPRATSKNWSSKATLSLWFIRRIVSDQSSPFSRTQQTIDRNILRCNTLMFSNCTFVSANVCKLKSMAGVTTALKNFQRNFKLTCLFVSMVRCLLNFAHAIVLRWSDSTQSRCLRFPGMCLPRYLWEDPSWRTCIKSCDTSTYIGVIQLSCCEYFAFGCIKLQTNVMYFLWQGFNHLHQSWQGTGI